MVSARHGGVRLARDGREHFASPQRLSGTPGSHSGPCLRAADAFPAASLSAREADLQQRAQHPARKAGPEGWGHWEAPLGARMSRKGGHAGPVWGGEELTCLESSESMRPEAQRRGPKTATRSKGVGDGFGVH